ncbi:MAG: hypothetical protein RsTaC01_0887 [Candidatus Paraimprobicoccus trichonymphae]|uniref:Uncharacterized protein n=1 Tax=Candidatus Paraimprobicoccus trichonymphae TaxID=3033793 RepID=A0AA48HWZ9_9FIRM|nr:MAG: hypothetical protein RsTaC01_0887 [Candidatus Paraimprobicoccus trichonymphae]
MYFFNIKVRNLKFIILTILVVSSSEISIFAAKNWVIITNNEICNNKVINIKVLKNNEFIVYYSNNYHSVPPANCAVYSLDEFGIKFLKIRGDKRIKVTGGNSCKFVDIEIEDIKLKLKEFSPIELSDEANVLLTCNGQNNLSSPSYNDSDIQVTSGNRIVITSITNSILNVIVRVSSDEFERRGSARIGGNTSLPNAGNIVIQGNVNIYSAGGGNGAGIGGEIGGSGENIVIQGFAKVELYYFLVVRKLVMEKTAQVEM